MTNLSNHPAAADSESVQQTTHLEHTAMLVSLHVTRWTGRKTDKAASSKLTDDNHASSGVARVSKDIIPRTHLAKITGHYDAAQRTVREHTLPWSDDGRRLVPSTVLFRLTEKLERNRTKFLSAVYDLQVAYVDEVEHAKVQLGTLFDHRDYPSAADVASRFTFGWSVEPVPVSGDIRVALPDSLRDKIANDMDKRMASRLEEATADTFRRVFSAVQRMHRTLSADKPRIFDSLAGDMASLIDVLPALNLSNNPDLTRLCSMLQREFAGVDSETLRRDEGRRASAADASAKIMAELEDLL